MSVRGKTEAVAMATVSGHVDAASLFGVLNENLQPEVDGWRFTFLSNSVKCFGRDRMRDPYKFMASLYQRWTGRCTSRRWSLRPDHSSVFFAEFSLTIFLLAGLETNEEGAGASSGHWPLSHSAARHKMAVRPKRNHAPARHRLLPQVRPLPVDFGLFFSSTN